MSQERSKFGSTARPGDGPSQSDAGEFAAGNAILIFDGLKMQQRRTSVAVMRPIGRKDASTD